MKIGCVILAGGKSSRMGQDKALLDLEGKKFIEHISEELCFFEEKMVARGENSALSELESLTWKVIPDIYPDHGPLGGIHAALKKCESDAMFCVSCDMPFLKGELATTMSNALTEEYDAVIAVGLDSETKEKRVHPLCGVYRKEIFTIMEEHLKQDNNRLMGILRRIRVKYISLDEKTSKQVTNVNTRSDYNKLKCKR